MEQILQILSQMDAEQQVQLFLTMFANIDPAVQEQLFLFLEEEYINATEWEGEVEWAVEETVTPQWENVQWFIQAMQ